VGTGGIGKGNPFGSELAADEVANDVTTQAELDNHASDGNNPHGVNASQAGALDEPASGDVRYPSRFFGSWYQPSTERPVEVMIDAHAESGGATAGSVWLRVDDNGDGAHDVTFAIAYAKASGLTTNPNVHDEGSTTVTLPPGGQYKIVNASDPEGGNSILDVREVTL